MDKRLNISFELNADIASSGPEEFEKNYLAVYKPLLTFLYTHPKFAFTFSFSGIQLEWIEERHPEAIDILGDLTSRKQVEVLGGGYYLPIFPLLFPVDRSGQIEKMTSELRNSIGKRPRGMSLYGSIWDPSLVTTIQACQIEYIHLDSTLIPSTFQKFLPVIMSEQGKTVKILYVCKYLLPNEFTSFDAWKEKLQPINDGSVDRHVTLQFSVEEMAAFMKSSMFTRIADCTISEDAFFNLVTPQQYLKNCRDFVTAYIPAGMEWNIAKWAKVPFEQTENTTHFPVTIYDFLNTYNQNHMLYERMMYVSMLLSQCHGDKMRKKAAREKLWEAQDGTSYVSLPSGLPAVAEKRQKSFRALNHTEKLLKEADDISESITSFDYNGDGLNDYICQMEKYHAVISPSAGSVVELDVINSSGDYAANLSRVEKFDKFQDDYKRGMFIEHIVEADNIKNFYRNLVTDQTSFETVNFEEKKFDNKRKEILLEGKGVASSLRQPVSLRKNYIVTSNGFSVQYILKNESPFALKGYFLIESNFARTCFDCEESQYQVELIADDNKKEVENQADMKVDSKVSVMQITDTQDKISFLFEPNEEAGFFCKTISFKRPDSKNSLKFTSSTLVSGLFWEIDLAPGMEMEKFVNFSIIPAKRRKSKQPAN